MGVCGGVCNVWVCVCVCVCVGVFCNVWVCVCVGFVMCECVCNMCLYLLCFALFVVYFCIVSFMFCLYQCKDYCHRVTTQLQLVVVVVKIIIIIIIIIITPLWCFRNDGLFLPGVQ